MSFADRRDAGQRLGQILRDSPLTDPVVVALPRGGVPVGFEVAAALQAPLDVLIARKIGAPSQPELGVGAIAEGGVTVFDEQTLRALRLTAGDMEATIERETLELRRRVRRYRGGAAPLELAQRSVIVVDDGLATGVTARAALRSVRQHHPARVLLAVPVGPPGAESFMLPDADAVVLAEAPPNLAAVGQWYDDFTQTSDDEVERLLALARSGP